MYMKIRPTFVSLLVLIGLSSADAIAAGHVVGVNQAGYTVAARKVSVMTTYADSFQVINAATRQAVYRNATGMATLGDAATGMDLYNADFSSIQTPGEYVLYTSAGDSSQHFLIADSVYNQAYRKSLKGFYYQRCGAALTSTCAQAYAHGVCHTADGTFHSTAEGTGTMEVKGGWHDAGDYGKYVVNGGISVWTLLAAYEWFPEKYAADDLNIPESGNGIPDILDEARYELQWFFKMQRSSDGGVYFKVTHENFEGFIMPQNDGGVRYIYQISSTATGNFVAAMARAARVFKPFDSTFASTCLAAAVKGWQYLQAHPSIVPSGGFKNPSGTVTGEYGDGSDNDERLWAAAELYLANGDVSAQAYFTANYASGGIVTGTMAWPYVKPLAELAFLRGTRSGIDTGIKSQIRQSLITYAGSLLTLRENSGFGAALAVYDYNWGSNSQALNNAILMIMAAEEGGQASLKQAACDQLHYVLGMNVHGQSFVTGVGARHTMHPHHRPSGADGIAEPVPGLISGGPNHNVSQDPVLAAHFTSSTPAALCYVDDQGSYASNEICINWNAPLVFVAGYFNLGTVTSVGDPSGSLHEERFRLDQNYPNPFNGATRITFTLRRDEQLEFHVIDILGKTVLKKNLGMCASGEHQFLWTATDQHGSPLSSGAYFYFLEGTNRSSVRKLVLLN
jgi:endoglucanase